MEEIRKPFQGIRNIIRFNWHFYVVAVFAVIALSWTGFYFPGKLQSYTYVICALIILSTFVSLLVSYYVYDRSKLYTLSWLDNVITGNEETVINIHAGFDETSSLLKPRFANASFLVFDFYDPKKHTEVSIKRARAAYPPFPGTKEIDTGQLPVQDGSADLIFLLFAAHEIRDDQERIVFFGELHRTLKTDGKIIVAEHLRDTANLLAYNIGFLHFLSLNTWIRTFEGSGFSISRQKKINPFVRLFILDKT